MIGAIVALNLLVLLGPPLISTDVFSYQAYARMGATYGINPYLHGPSAINLDPIFPYVGAKWFDTDNAYGPLFTVFSYAFAKLSIATSVYIYKAIAGAAALGLVAVVWRCAGELRTNQVRAVALVGLNPLLIVYGVGGGHNDLLMLLAVTGALYALVCGRERLGGTLGVVAAGIKLTGGLMLPFAIAAEGPRRGHRRRRDLLLAIAASIAAIAVLNFAVFGSGGFHLLGTLSQGQKEGSWNSIPGFISAKLGLHTISRGDDLRAGGRVRRGLRLAAAPRLARADGLDRRGRLGDAGGAAGLQLAAAVVCGLDAAAGRARPRPPSGAGVGRDDRDRARSSS